MDSDLLIKSWFCIKYFWYNHQTPVDKSILYFSISQCSLMNAELAGLKMQKEDDGECHFYPKYLGETESLRFCLAGTDPGGLKWYVVSVKRYRQLKLSNSQISATFFDTFFIKFNSLLFQVWMFLSWLNTISKYYTFFLRSLRSLPLKSLCLGGANQSNTTTNSTLSPFVCRPILL